jgi:hypothetical protein
LGKNWIWDFDCRYGANEASCGVIHVSEINKVISEADAEGYDKGSFLLFLALGYFCIINADAPYFFNLESFLPFFLPQVF